MSGLGFKSISIYILNIIFWSVSSWNLCRNCWLGDKGATRTWPQMWIHIWSVLPRIYHVVLVHEVGSLFSTSVCRLAPIITHCRFSTCVMWTEKRNTGRNTGRNTRRNRRRNTETPPPRPPQNERPKDLSLLLLIYIVHAFNWLWLRALRCVFRLNPFSCVRSHLSSSVFFLSFWAIWSSFWSNLLYFWPVDEVILLSYRRDYGRRSTFGSTFHTSC